MNLTVTDDTSLREKYGRPSFQKVTFVELPEAPLCTPGLAPGANQAMRGHVVQPTVGMRSAQHP